MKATGIFKCLNRLRKGLILLLCALFVASCTLGEDHVKGYVGLPSAGGGSSGPGTHQIVLSPTSATLSVQEGAQIDSIIRLSRGPDKKETLYWKIHEGEGSFVSHEGSEALHPDTEEVRIPLLPVDDGIYQGERRYQLEVWGEAEIFYAPVRVEIRVVDSTPAPVVSFALPAQTVTEGDPVVSVEAILSTPSASPLVVQFSASGSAQGNGVDYSLSPQESLIFHPGEVSKTIQVHVVDDSEIEPMEEIVLTLSAVTQGEATIDGAHQQHLVWILDNDGPMLFSIEGITGGADGQKDEFLTDGQQATVHWSSAVGALQYEVVIFHEDGASVACGPRSSFALSQTFNGCDLEEGKAYRVSVVATTSSGDTVPAGNNMFLFRPMTEPPGSFSVLGVTGGLDRVPNSVLSGGVYPTVHWTDSDSEHEYLITIYESGGSTVKCAEQKVPANVTALAFDQCQLNAGATYQISVRARNIAGNEMAAINSPYPFTVTNQPTGYMITGVTGGVADQLIDDKMTDGQNPTVHWHQALGAINYDVRVWNEQETQEICPLANVGTTSHTFTDCDLELHEVYKVEVVARNAGGETFEAANSKFSFRYMAGLYISGAGESYHRGEPIITCGGGNGDVCNASTPYVVSGVLNETQIRVAQNGVLAGGAWAAGPAVPGNGILEIEVNRLWVEQGSSVSMTGRGYTAGVGPGAGEHISGSRNGGTGGAYGGGGGYNNGQSSSPYGSINNPSHLGSGGGSNISHEEAIGGSGGGIVRLKVAGTLDLNGTIESSGAPGVGKTSGSGANQSTFASGGGSGGSVFMEVERLTGTTGQVLAHGGSGGSSGQALGGSGSGGRMHIIVEEDDYSGGLMALTTQAFGGTAANARAGAAGTALLKGPGHSVGHLIVDNGPNPYREGVETPAPVGMNLDSWETRNLGTLIVGALDQLTLFSNVMDYRLVVQGQISMPAENDLIIASGGRLDWRQKTKISYDTLTIETGGVLTHSYNDSEVEYYLDLDVAELYLQGVIDVSARGYASRQGPGRAGANGGGSYGGVGGRASFGPYGSIKAPAHLGSGGGAGSGGGMVLIHAGERFELTGEIRANGADGQGGGSGGTIHISTAKLSGAGGLLQALGGGHTSSSAGGGSGGRIAILLNEDEYTGGALGLNAQAHGGPGGWADGAAGTVFIQRVGVDPHGHLWVGNGSRSYNEEVTTPLLVVEDFDVISTDSSGTLHIPFDSTFNLPSDVIDYRLVLEGNMTLPSSDLTLAAGGYLEVRRSFPLVYDNFVIQHGATLTHTTNTDRKDHYLDIQVGNFTLEGEIDITGKGYTDAEGPGAAPSITAAAAPGAGHGGWGGLVPGAGGGLPYGDFKNPDDLGSGGGNYRASNGSITRLGGAGGGLLRLQVADAFTLKGVIRADGAGGRNTTGTQVLRGGGGSGGSVYLKTDRLLGEGASLYAVGGTGSGTAGNGSGGRIALIYNQDQYIGGAMSIGFQAHGGGASGRAASAGSIFVFDAGSEDYGHLIVDNNNLPHVEGSETPAPVGEDLDSYITRNNGVLLVSPGENFLLHSHIIDYNLVVQGAFSLPGGGQDLVIAQGGFLEWRRPTPLVLNSLTIEEGGVLTHSANGAGPSHLLDLQLGSLDLKGLIEVSGQGFGAGQGPGAGDSSSGAAYGGQGGVGSSGFVSATYGDPKEPTNLGSSSAQYRGGGLVRALVSGLAQLEGEIRADGEGSSSACGGGASGGTIDLNVHTLRGSGARLSASGGVACTTGDFGGGGGGRIALKYDVDEYTGGASALTLEAYGGQGGARGAAGTIFLRDRDADTHGRLIVDNGGGASSTLWTSTRLPHNGLFDDVQVGSSVKLEIPKGSHFALPAASINYHLVLGGSLSFPGSDFTVASGGTLELRNNMPLTFGSLTVETGATLTHTPNTTLRAYVLDLKVGDLTLNGEINVDGKGYRGGSGPGAPAGGSYGGSYAGTGGPGATASSTPGLPYGNARQPYELGSGGATSSGGAGGGLVSLDVSGTFTFNGNIYARGAEGASSPGGSGGTVHLKVNELTGAGGDISVNGGNGQGSSGSGSGGRVAISYNLEDALASINLKAQGGTTNDHQRVGAAGTIYLLDTSDPANKGHLIVNNGLNPYRRNVNTYILDGFQYDNYTVTPNSGLYVPQHVTFTLFSDTLTFPLKVAGQLQWPFAHWTLASGASLDWETHDPIVVDQLTMESGSYMTHASNTTTKRYYLDLRIGGDFLMEEGAHIDAMGMGYGGGYGPGRGVNGHSPTYSASGGSYGGHGGVGKGGTAASALYGVAEHPSELGSGGGHQLTGTTTVSISQRGVAGGGLISIDVGGEFDFRGSMDASGEAATLDYIGAGSGGSIYILAGTLSGEGGVLKARGGNARNTANGGGTGGGGRVFLGYTAHNYSAVDPIQVDVTAGTGYIDYLGEEGTFEEN